MFTVCLGALGDAQVPTVKEREQQSAPDVRNLQVALDELVALQRELNTNQAARMHTTCFRVERIVNVREWPSTKSRKLAQLHPGAIIATEEGSRHWVRVHVESHLTGVVLDGWAWKKNLSRCEE